MSKVAEVNSKNTDKQMPSSIGTCASETVPTTKPSVNETKQEYEPRTVATNLLPETLQGQISMRWDLNQFEPTSRKLDSRISLRRFAKYW